MHYVLLKLLMVSEWKLGRTGNNNDGHLQKEKFTVKCPQFTALKMGLKPLGIALWLMEDHGLVWLIVWDDSIASLCGEQFLSPVSGGSAGSSQGGGMMPRSTRVA